MRFDRMTRRCFVAALAATAASTVSANAQLGGRRPKLGVVYPGPTAMALPRMEAFLAGVRSAGFAEDQIELVLRAAEGDPKRIPALVEEIVSRQVDVILAIGSGMVHAFQPATKTIPIIALDLESDPVASGFIATLARPGGNITGLFFDFPDFSRKWLEILREAIPKLSRLAVLYDPGNPGSARKVVEQAAADLSIQPNFIEVRTQSDFAGAFAAASRQNADAVVMLSSPLIGANVGQLAQLAMQHRLAAMTLFPDFARGGGLLAYGVNLLDMYRQTGNIAAKVLQGRKPAELPIERPAKFELLLNLKTAKILGLDIPTSILLRADDVIE